MVAQSPRRHRALRATLSAIALTLIVVAVPLGLYKLGGLPGFHIDLGQAAKDISHHPDGQRFISHWLLRSALLLAWISWVWTTICVALEIRSRITGRRSARLPASKTVQSVAAFLVGTALAISSMGRLTAVTKTGGPRSPSVARAGSAVASGPGGVSVMPLRVIEVHMEAAQLRPPDEGSERNSSGAPAIREPDIGIPPGKPASDNPRVAALAEGVTIDSLRSWGQPNEAGSSRSSHVVAARETLWSIAEERLGSPLRWKEIAVLNYEVRQGDGGTLTAEHWIRPGWTLELPRSNGGQAFGGAPADEQLAWPSTERSSFPTGSHGADGGQGVNGRLRQPNTPLMPVGGGVVGAGVVGLLDRMRRVQQRYRSEGSYIRLPDRTHSQFEQRLRLGEGREIVRTVDAALRLLWQAWPAPASSPPSVMGVTVHRDSIELFVDRIEGWEALPPQFRRDSDRRSVSVDRALLLTVEPDGTGDRPVNPPAPLMVTAGHGPDGLVMVNLEALGTLLVNGDPTACEGIVRALALELATSHWAGWFDLNVVGFGVELERFERVVAVSDIPTLLDRLHRHRLEGEEHLREAGFRSFAEARCVDHSAKWDPLVVLCGPMIDGTDVAEFVDLSADPHLGIAVVASGPAVGASHALGLAGGNQTASLELLGSVLSPQQLGLHELDEVTALVETAANRQSVLLSEEPYVSLPVSMPLPMPASSRAPEEEMSVTSLGVGSSRNGRSVRGHEVIKAEIEVEVSVLGQIEIVGAAREFTRAWSRELVVYLAMHPNGASNEAWATALWPDRLMAPSSLHSTASVARRALGQASNGEDHLPRSHGRLVLADTVGTDWDRFVGHADGNDPAGWRTALELVRGRPFDGLRSSDWPILEGISPAIEAAVVDLSGRLAGSCLAVGDARGAEWAARRGLVVSPYDERLYRMLMRAADVGGNPAGVESAMSELIRLVANEIEPLDSVHPSTMELYRSLTRRRNGTSRFDRSQS